MGRIEYAPSDKSGKIVYLYGFRLADQGDLEDIFGPVCQKTGAADYHEVIEVKGRVVIQIVVSSSRNNPSSYVITGCSNSSNALDVKVASLLRDPRVKFAGQDEPVDMPPDELQRVKRGLWHDYVDFKRDLRKRYHIR